MDVMRIAGNNIAVGQGNIFICDMDNRISLKTVDDLQKSFVVVTSFLSD